RGSQGQTIYYLSLDVAPGSLLQANPRQKMYYPIDAQNEISSIMMKLAHQSGRQIDFNND
ncbi:hypothetical protein ACJMK2_031466, partial [Sinanodonta woodiana]